MVFVDEADQAAGKREGGDTDRGLSGRVYAMLAKEMSDTRNRGRILWVFATSRPDLLEVDLKRQGRLDVHIPLFAPETPEEMRALFLAIASKLKFPLEDADLAGARSDHRVSAATRSRACWCGRCGSGSWRPRPRTREAAAARHPGRRAAARCGRARTRASSNTWTSSPSRSAPTSASCRRGSAT